MPSCRADLLYVNQAFSPEEHKNDHARIQRRYRALWTTRLLQGSIGERRFGNLPRRLAATSDLDRLLHGRLRRYLRVGLMGQHHLQIRLPRPGQGVR